MGDIRYGTITGLGGRFALVRSYVKGFATNWPPGCTQTTGGNPMILTLPPSYGSYYKLMRLKDTFYAWNSNVNTMDYVFEDFYVASPLGVRQDAEPFALGLRPHPVNGSIYLALDIGYWTDWYYFDIPSGPSSYWLPPL